MTRKFVLLSAVAAMFATSAFISPAFASDKGKELSNPNGDFVVGSAPSEIVSPIDNGYACMADYITKFPTRYRYAVGRITDQTGKFSNEASAGGFEVTQGLPSEVYSALDKLGVRVVERTDTEIPNFDIGVWKQQLLGDDNFAGVTDKSGHLVESQKTGEPLGKGLAQYHGGQIQSVDYYITGAITAINYDTKSGGAELFVQNIGGGHRIYTMDIDMDLRIVDAHTLEVVKSEPVHKVVWGYENEAGIYNFLGRYLINFNAGSKAQEPRELGLRAAMEDAVLRLVGSTMPTLDGSNFGRTCADYGEVTYGDVRRALHPAAFKKSAPITPPVTPEPAVSSAGKVAPLAAVSPTEESKASKSETTEK